ncbi:MAG: hypothetical protein H6719_30910 [Sandaracinaceae bacterium]|nr:hypothetical protein [Sandaracinaceae bacterium]
MLWSSGYELVYELARASGGGYEEHEALMNVNPLVVTLGCALGFVASLVLHLVKVRVPTLVPIGVGMLLISASLVALLTADSADDAIVTPAVVLMAVGELLAAPLLLSRLMGDLHERLPTLAVAVFYLLSGGPMLLLRAVSEELDLTRTLSGLGAASAGLVGLAFVVLGLLLYRRLFPDPEAPKVF